MDRLLTFNIIINNQLIFLIFNIYYFLNNKYINNFPKFAFLNLELFKHQLINGIRCRFRPKFIMSYEREN